MPFTRVWTDSELAQVKVWYCQLNWTAGKIAHKLGLTVSSVQARLRRAGLRNNKCPHYFGSLDRLVKSLHAKGMNDREMAARISELMDKDVYSASVKRSRGRLGLPSNYDSTKHREKIVAAIREVCTYQSPARVRYTRERAESTMAGWPPVTLSMCKMLQFIETAKEATVEEIGMSVGITPFSANKALRRLTNQGWVCSKLRSSGVRWMLSDSVKEIRQRWQIENRERT